MDKTKDRKNALIVALVAVVLFMSLGYAAFASSLQINGTAKTTGSWDVKFTALDKTLSSGATEVVPSSFTGTTVLFNVELHAPGDSAVYVATIKNNGTISAKLSSIVAPNLDGTDPIKYSMSGISTNDVLAPGATRVVTITVQYDQNITQPTENVYSKDLAITFNFEQNI